MPLPEPSRRPSTPTTMWPDLDLFDHRCPHTTRSAMQRSGQPMSAAMSRVACPGKGSKSPKHLSAGGHCKLGVGRLPVLKRFGMLRSPCSITAVTARQNHEVKPLGERFLQKAPRYPSTKATVRFVPASLPKEPGDEALLSAV